MSDVIPVAKVCDNCGCYDACIYANPRRKHDCSLWKPNMEWIPVSERLPDKNNPVLVYCTNTTIGGGYITHIGSFNSGKYWFLRAEPGIATFPVREWQVTHWMPLPEPPKEATNV